MFPSRLEGSRSSDRVQFQCGELIVDTVVAVAISAIAFALAGRFDWHQPRLAMSLRMVPVGVTFLWLLRRFCSCPSDYWSSPERSGFYYPDDDRSTIVRPGYFRSFFHSSNYHPDRGPAFQTMSTAPGQNHSYTDGRTVVHPTDVRRQDQTQIFPAGGSVTRGASTTTSGRPGASHSYTNAAAPAAQPQSGGGSFWSTFSSTAAQEPTIFAAGGSSASRSNNSGFSSFGTTSSFSTASSFPSVTTATTPSSPTIFPASGGNMGGGGPRHTYTS